MSGTRGNSCNCQFCTISKTSNELIWPVACREHIAALQRTSSDGHTLLGETRATLGRNAKLDTPEILSIVCSLFQTLDKANTARTEWWWKKENREKRAYWKSEIDKEARRERYERGPASEEGKMRKSLQAMQSINTKAKDAVIDINTKLEYFCRYVLGVFDPKDVRGGEAIGVKIDQEDERGE